MAARAWHRFSSRKMHRGISDSPIEETKNLSPKASFGATEI
jgi:hypothetical protein